MIPRHRWPIVVAVCFLLPGLYVGSSYPVAFAFGAGWLPRSWERCQIAWAPLNHFAESGVPGFETLRNSVRAAYKVGESLRGP